MSALPFALDAWYPATRGPLRSPRVLGADRPTDEDRARAAWDSLGPGQALVVVDGGDRGLARGLVARGGRRSLAARLAASLPGAGSIDRWFVAPGTGGSHVLLPVEPAGFLAALPLLPAGRLRWRVVRRVMAAAGRRGLAGRAGMDEVLVAVKGGAGGPPLPLPSPGVPWIADLARPHLGLALGVPGLFRKAVVRVAAPDGQVLGILKLPVGRAAGPQVRREARWLKTLGAPWAGSTAPALVASGRTDGIDWLVQEVLGGRRSPDGITPAHLEFLARLQGATGRAVAFEELELFADAAARIEDLRGSVDRAWLAAMEGLRDALGARLAGSQVPCALSHGDFTPWNLLICGDGLRAFDWEFADERPALFDLFHFHVQTGVLVRRAPARAIRAGLEALIAGPAGSLVESADVDWEALAGLYLLHVATFDEQVNRIERPPFVQVDWLRGARVELARLLAESSEVLAA